MGLFSSPSISLREISKSLLFEGGPNHLRAAISKAGQVPHDNVMAGLVRPEVPRTDDAAGKKR